MIKILVFAFALYLNQGAAWQWAGNFETWESCDASARAAWESGNAAGAACQPITRTAAVACRSFRSVTGIWSQECVRSETLTVGGNQ